MPVKHSYTFNSDMRRFVVRLLLAVVPFVALLVALVRIAYLTELDLLKRDLTFSPEVRATIVGDSRVEGSFDSGEIPWLQNCGKSGMPFAVTAQKAKLIAELNPKLELIVIDVSPGRFFEMVKPFDELPWCPLGVSLVELMTREDMPPFGGNFHMRLTHGLLLPGLKHRLFQDEPVKSLLAGGYVQKYGFLKADAKFEPDAKNPRVKLSAVPPHGERILDNLLLWMREHKRKVILTTTPIYELYWEMFYSEEARLYFERRMAEISKKHRVHWYNWLHEYQGRIDFWADGYHLNYSGAQQFSRDKRPILESECRVKD